jgi:hypothetical protein
MDSPDFRQAFPGFAVIAASSEMRTIHHRANEPALNGIKI